MEDMNLFSSNIFNLITVDNTSAGYLLKRINRDDYRILSMDKTGVLVNRVFDNLQPIMEMISFEIGKSLGINVARYELHKEHLDINQRWISQDILFTRTEWFYDSSREKLIFAKDLIPKEYFSKPEAYKYFIDHYPEYKADIDDMIIFDFIINNTDRHYKNFGIIAGEDERIAPIYDNGNSLGFDFDDDYLELLFDEDIDDYDLDLDVNLDNMDIAKPFYKSHHMTISLIDNTAIIKRLNRDEILDIVDRYSEYLSDIRVKFIKVLLNRRIDDLIKRFGDGNNGKI